MRIVVLGYYFRNNLGDDAFIAAFEQLFKNVIVGRYCVLFKNIENIEQLPPDTDILICGAGDIVNDYFVERIRKVVDSSPYFSGPIWAISIGVSGHELVDFGYLDVFDHVLLRSKTDLDTVSKRLGAEYVNVLPDITFYLSPGKTQVQRGLVGVFLARPIVDNVDGYMDIVKNIALSIDHMIQEYNVQVILYCFNTDTLSERENDQLINADLFNCIRYKSNVKCCNDRMDYFQMQETIHKLSAALCMRFHSHVFCITNAVPFLSLDCSPKVHKLCEVK